jgi:hypothetical protein
VGKAQKRRGRLDELTGSLGREEGGPEEEIDAELRRAGGAPATAVLHLRSREEKWRG